MQIAIHTSLSTAGTKHGCSIFGEIAHKWILHDFTDDDSTLV